jgi:hypothetical protein
MARMAGVLLAGGLIAACGASAAFADAPSPTDAPRARRLILLRPVIGRAHLVFRTAEDQPPLEGVVTVIQTHPDWNTAAVGVVMAPCPDPPTPASPPPAPPGSPSES